LVDEAHRGRNVIDVDDGVYRLADQRIRGGSLLCVEHVDLHAIRDDRLDFYFRIGLELLGEVRRNAGHHIRFARLEGRNTSIRFRNEIVSNGVEIGRPLARKTVWALIVFIRAVVVEPPKDEMTVLGPLVELEWSSADNVDLARPFVLLFSWENHEGVNGALQYVDEDGV